MRRSEPPIPVALEDDNEASAKAGGPVGRPGEGAAGTRILTGDVAWLCYRHRGRLAQRLPCAAGVQREVAAPRRYDLRPDNDGAHRLRDVCGGPCLDWSSTPRGHHEPKHQFPA